MCVKALWQAVMKSKGNKSILNFHENHSNIHLTTHELIIMFFENNFLTKETFSHAIPGEVDRTCFLSPPPLLGCPVSCADLYSPQQYPPRFDPKDDISIKSFPVPSLLSSEFKFTSPLS